MQNKTFRQVLTILGLAAFVGLGSGCSWSIGDGRGHVATNQPTKGQELLDLKKAHDSGALNDAEYEAQRNHILSK